LQEERLIGTALSGSHISRFTARLLWAEASLGGRLGAAFLLMQCVFGSSCPASGGAASSKEYLKTMVVRYAVIDTKEINGAAFCASCEQCLEKRWHKGKFWCGQNLPLCSN